MNVLSSSAGRRLLILAVLALLVGLLAAPVRAAETRGGDNVVIGATEVIEDDLYVATNTLTIDGTIKGDLVAIASRITINGRVEGDLLAAGQAVVINGTVSDDVRAAGQAVLLGPSARVIGDLAIAGMSLENQAGSVVRGDVLVGAYQALLAGEVGKNVTGSTVGTEVHGTVAGNMDIAVGSGNEVSPLQFSPAAGVPIPTVRPGLTLASSARIGGKLSYTSTTESTIGPAQVAGGIAYNRLPVSQPSTMTRWAGLAYLQRLAGLLLVGLLLLWIVPSWTRRMADSVEARPLPSLGWGVVGFVAFIAAVFAILVLMIVLAIIFGVLTLGGLVAMIVSLGLLANAALVIGFVTFAAYVAEVVIGLMAGRWLLARTQPAWAEQPLIPLALGLVIYVILTAIPLLGALIGPLVTLLALGALWEWGHARFWRPGTTPKPIGGLQTA